MFPSNRSVERYKESIERTPGPGDYNVSAKEQPHSFQKSQPFGSKCPRFKEIHSQQIISTEENESIEIRKKVNIRNIMQRYKRCYYKSKVEKPFVLVEQPKVQKSFAIEHIDHEMNVERMKMAKETMKHVVNMMNKIAFNAHQSKVNARSFITPKDTPGPGYYDPSEISLKRIKNLQNINAHPEDRSKWLRTSGDKIIGPGCYYKDSEWITPSYNITMPNNVICKRKKIIKEKSTYKNND